MNRLLKQTLRDLVIYVSANPAACDTPDGICRWWLMLGQDSEATVEEALQYLVGQGLFEQLAAADGRQRYRCCAGGKALGEALSRFCNQSGSGH